MFFVWALAIIACLLLVFCALIFSSCGPKDSGVPITTEPPHQSESPSEEDGASAPPEGGDTQGGGEGTQGGEPGSETGLYPAGGGDRIFVARVKAGES